MALTLVLFGASLGVDAAQAAKAAKPAKPAEPQGPLVFVSNVLDLTVSVIEPKTGRTRKLPVGALPHNFSLSPDGKEVLVINTGSESVSFFDARTGDKKRDMLITPIPKNPKHDKLGWDKFKGKTSCHQCHGPNAVGRLPSSAVYALDGTSLWTVPFNPPGIIRVDRATGKALQEIEIAEPPFTVQASNVGYTPDGQTMVIVHRRSSKSKLKLPTMGTAYDAPKDMTAFDHDAPPGNKASLITFHTPDGTKELGRLVVPISLPFKMTFDPTGKRMYVAYRSSNKVAEIDLATRSLKRLLTVGEGPNNAVVDKEGKYLYAPSFYDEPPEVVKLELKTGLVRALLPAKVSPTMVEIDPDTGLLYAVINANNRLLEIDPKGKGKITKDLPAGAFPLDVLVVPESHRRKIR